MDKSDTLRNLLIAMALFFTVLWLGPRLFPPPPSQTPGPVEDERPLAGEQMAENGARAPETAVISGQSVAGAPSPVAKAETTPPEVPFTVIEAGSEQTFAMGSGPANGVAEKPENSPYRMRLILSNVGASIESATITDHAEVLESADRYQLLAATEGEDGTPYRSLAVEKVTLDDVPLPLSDQTWHTEGVKPYTGGSGEAGERIEFWIEIHQADRPVLRLTRTFTLAQQSVDAHRHDLNAEIEVGNLSDEPHRVIVTYRGGLGVRKTEAARMVDQYVDWGIYREGRVQGERKRFADVHKDAGQTLLVYRPESTEPDARLAWAATANTYFTCTLAPLNPNASDNASYLTRVEAVDVDGSPMTANDATLRFVTREASVEPRGTLHYPAAVYLGEKDGYAFKAVPEYQRRNYYYQIAQGFGWCTFTFLVELMIWLLNTLCIAVRDYGVAIIILVLVVRVLLHPITKKGQVNMVRMQHRMQEMAPKIEEIKKKYANDKARLNQEMMKLNINPAGQLFTCLPMMLQMPIWIALYLSLANNILMRHQPFHGTWIHDLTAQDALYTFSAPITVPLLGWVIPSLNLLPILVGVFMYTQQKLQPKPAPNPNMTDQQRQQQEMMQKMMPLMSVMMLIIFYKMPAGLNLYIMASSLFGTIEQKLIRKHIKEREEAGTLHKPEKKEGPPPDKPRKPGGSSLWNRLQKAAEQAQKAPPRRPKKVKSRR